MARNDVDIHLRVKASGVDQGEKVANSIRRVGDEAEKSGKKTDSFFRGILQGAGQQAFNFIANNAQRAVSALIDFSQESATLAANAAETESLLRFSLGPAYDDFTGRIDDLAEATGRSATKFQDSVSPIIAMTKNMGFANDEAANMSFQFGQAALDLNSFFNSATGFEDIQSALAGSSETLQKYGIDVRETTLIQAALDSGLIKTKDQYDRQIRTLTILSEIQRQASDAMGDAARTADSAANQQRAYEDAIHDLQIAIGEELLPIQKELTSLQLQFIKSVGPDFVQTISEGVSVLFDLAAGMREVKSIFPLFPESGGDLSFLTVLLGVSPALGQLVISGKQTRFEQALQEAQQKRLTDAVSGYEAELTDTIYTQRLATDAAFDEAKAAEEVAAAYADAIIERDKAFNAQTLGFGKRTADEFREMTLAGEFFAKVVDRSNEALRVTPELAKEAGEAVQEKLFAEGKEFAITFTTDLESISAAQKEAEKLGEAFNVSLRGLDGKTIDELIFEMGQKAGVSAPLLARLAFETGNYSTEAINAALETATMQAKIDELAGKVAEGLITWDQAVGQLTDFRLGLEEGRQSRLDAIEDFENINGQLDKIDGDRSATINIKVDGLADLERAVNLAERIATGGVITASSPLVQKAQAAVSGGGGSTPPPSTRGSSSRNRAGGGPQ